MSEVQGQLKRRMGIVSAITVTVGSVIGSGIFLKPRGIAENLPDATWIYGCWAGLGVICLFGALAYGELGTMFPQAGGQYAFLREGWGRFPAFLYGWCLALVINSGTLAALAAATAENVSYLTPLTQLERNLIATAMILLLTVINHFGVRYGAWFQNISTTAKLAALAVIVAGVFRVDTPAPTAVLSAAADTTPLRLTGIVAAAVAIFWAYEGWYQLPFNAAELKNPRRQLPLGLVLGVAITIVAYIAVNAAFMRVVPQSEMLTFDPDKPILVPQTAVERLFGASASTWLFVAICISVIGAANTNLLSSPRAFYAMAEDGLVPRPLVKVHPRFGTPVVAIWSQALWAVLLIFLLKRFPDLTDYVVFASLLFYALTVGSLYVLRRRLPDHPRPFKCWGYPVTPAIFILVVLVVDVVTLLDVNQRTNALIGLAIIAAGVPVYFLMEQRRRRAGAP